MISTSKIVATMFIVAGGAIVGAITGWNLGPMKIVLTAEQLAAFGGSFASILALWGCCSAMDRVEAHARNQQTLSRVEWQLCKIRDSLGSKHADHTVRDSVS